MYLKTLNIKGYRTFKDDFTVHLNSGLNILVGENASGKSTVIDAIRLILLEDEFGRAGISETDFHRPIDHPAKSKGVDQISFKCDFKLVNENEQIAYLPWLQMTDETNAILNLSIENKEDNRGKFKRKIWGNESEAGLFEWELLNRISCVYLPPLRNAEEKLRSYKGSKLARLLKNLKKMDANDEQHPLEKKFAALNKQLLADESIQIANKFIKDNIVASVGGVFGQDASLQFSEINFDRIVERIRLLFYPLLPQAGSSNNLNLFRELSENSLGYNNILYLATILSELDGKDDNNVSHKILLIEEPEAHLHPQLQIRLMQYLQTKAEENKLQIIVTTHSPTLTSSINLHSIKVLSLTGELNQPQFTTIANCGVSDPSKRFLERWLDITKSLLFFSKGILFVEGIAEALVIKELAKIILQKLKGQNLGIKIFNDLEEYGISIINLNGIYFRHFFSLFQGFAYNDDDSIYKCDGIPVKCAGLTDNDPVSESKPTINNPFTGNNPQLYLMADLEKYSSNCRLYSNLKTFEYDLALEGNNISFMAKTLLRFITTNGSIKKTLNEYAVNDWTQDDETKKADAAYWLLMQIDAIGKGEFAQALADDLVILANSFIVPTYIEEAVKWLVINDYQS